MVEIWKKCWNCDKKTRHLRLSLSYFPRIVEMFAKKEDGTVDHRLWAVMYGAYQFAKCKGCEAPSLFVDEYWPKTETGDEILKIQDKVDKTGILDDKDVAGAYAYPAFNKAPFPKWTHDLEVEQMRLFWEVYTALSLKLNSIAAMGIRAIIDGYIVRKIGDVGTFKQKIEKLLSIGEITRLQHDHIQVIIDVGNAASHRGFRPTSADIKICMEIVEDLLARERYGPMIDALRKNIPKRP